MMIHSACYRDASLYVFVPTIKNVSGLIIKLIIEISSYQYMLLGDRMTTDV